MGMPGQPKRLRDAIPQGELRSHIDAVWDKSEPHHARQSKAGGPDNGRKHCEAVESYCLRIWQQCNLPLTESDCYLLSAAACCHDFGKGLSDTELRVIWGGNAPPVDDARTRHGYDSGRYAQHHHDEVGLTAKEALWVDRIVRHHALRGAEFAGSLSGDGELTDQLDLDGETVHPRLLAKVLKLADFLHSGDRVRKIEIETAKLQAAQEAASDDARCDADFAVLRGSDSYWTIHQPRSLVFTIIPESEDDRAAVSRALELMAGEFAQYADVFQRSELPERFALKIEGPHAPPPPAAIEASAPWELYEPQARSLAKLGLSAFGDLIMGGTYIADSSGCPKRSALCSHLAASTTMEFVRYITQERWLSEAGSRDYQSLTALLTEVVRTEKELRAVCQGGEDARVASAWYAWLDSVTPFVDLLAQLRGSADDNE